VIYITNALRAGYSTEKSGKSLYSNESFNVRIIGIRVSPYADFFQGGDCPYLEIYTGLTPCEIIPIGSDPGAKWVTNNCKSEIKKHKLIMVEGHPRFWENHLCQKDRRSFARLGYNATV
jgi:hypothetical protein